MLRTLEVGLSKVYSGKKYRLFIILLLFASTIYLLANEHSINNEVREKNCIEYKVPFTCEYPDGAIVSTYFNGKVYFFSRRHSDVWISGVKGDFIKSFKFDIDDNGMLQNFVQNQCQVVTGESTSGTSLCACPYRGEIYVFYDSITSDNSKRYISYKTNSDPENSPWSPTGGRSVALEGSPFLWNVRFGDDSELPLLTATEFKGRLYLFYAKRGDSAINMLSFDGQTWQKKKCNISSLGKVHSMSAQAVINDEDSDSFIALAVKHDNGFGNIISIRAINEDAINGKGEVIKSNTSLTNIPDGSVQAVFGTISNSEGNTLIIAVDDSFYPGKLYSYTLPKDIASGIFKEEEKMYGKPVIIVSSFGSRNHKDMTMHTVLVIPHTYESYLYCMQYKSDRFEFIEEVEINGNDPKNIGSWILLGVIEGLPPYIPGVSTADELPVSMLTFSHSNETDYSIKSHYNNTISMGPKITCMKTGANIGLSFQRGLGAICRADKNFVISTTTYLFPGSCTKDKFDGNLGYLLFEKPTYILRCYKRYPVDSNKDMGNVIFCYVKELILTFEPYTFNDHTAGSFTEGMSVSPPSNCSNIKKVPSSNDLKGWFFKDDDGKVFRGDWSPLHSDGMGLLTWNHVQVGTGRVTSSISFSSVSSRSYSKESQFELSTNFVFWVYSTNLSFTQETQHEFSNGSTISMSVCFPETLPPQYKKFQSMTIQPLLLLPSQEVSKASWIPNMYKNSKAWLLTWKITDLEEKNLGRNESVRMEKEEESITNNEHYQDFEQGVTLVEPAE